MLEELRVSLFAQELRTPMPVSAKRLQKVWESMQRIAIDPSLWWNGGQLAKRLAAQPPATGAGKTLYIAVSADGLPDVDAALKTSLGKAPGLGFSYEAWPGETHATVYHPAALKAFRAVLKPR
jgi:predicted alpha/beta superfamily hydrolase